MGGGMDGQNRPIGGLDLFNNVVYNWNRRTTASTAAYYNLAGQRVVKPARGIYIQNGRKVVVR